MDEAKLHSNRDGQQLLGKREESDTQFESENQIRSTMASGAGQSFL